MAAPMAMAAPSSWPSARAAPAGGRAGCLRLTWAAPRPKA